MSAAAQSADVSTASAQAGTAPAAPAFEQSLAELEALVSQLESGDLPLDQALRTFEQGVRLTRECQSALSLAQQKVQLLLQRGESAVIEEFDQATVER
ncbi:MAG: exodeoxyribonuclease VII small subunit, partial [Steroidobacteraceae bacterium]